MEDITDPGHRARRNNRSQAAFSLIELLVVVAIIAVLSAMVLPAIALVRDQAKSMKCQSILRQFALADLAYATDYHGTYAVFVGYYANGNQSSYWFKFQPFGDYLNVPDVKANNGWPMDLRCPSSTPTQWFTVGRNGNGVNFHTRGVAWVRRLGTIATPGETMAWADGLDWNLGAVAGLRYPGESLQSGWMAARHRLRANVSYFDGRLESVPLATLKPLTAIDRFWYAPHYTIPNP